MPASQAGRRGFDPRLPLFNVNNLALSGGIGIINADFAQPPNEQACDFTIRAGILW